MAADWLIQIPLSELAALQGLPARMESLEKETAQLRGELEAMRRNYSDALVLIGDLRKELRKR